MFSIKQPTAGQYGAFLEKEQKAGLTYPFVGGTRGLDRAAVRACGFDTDHQKICIGHGLADFERAKEGLQTWRHFPPNWTRIVPNDTPVRPQETLGMTFRLFGLWWRNSCRVVYVTEEDRRYGFAYGTLPGHIESGEELFAVEMDGEGRVWYEIMAFSKPHHALAWMGYPLVRLFQEKFRQDSAEAMRLWVAGKDAQKVASWTPDRWVFQVLLFVLSAILSWSGTIMGHDYGKIPLFFGFFCVVPFCLHLLDAHLGFGHKELLLLRKAVLPAAVLVSVSYFLPEGVLAGAFSAGWLAVCFWIASFGARLLLRKGLGNAAFVVMSAGLLQAGVAGMFTLADRLGWQPLGFGAEIVRLTALHFHYAGLAVPLMLGILTLKSPNFLLKITSWCVTLGVPLTALGIIATQWHQGPMLETFASVFMAFSGILTAVCCFWVGYALRNAYLKNAAWVLFGSMLLAAGYGLRSYWPGLALDLDNMRAIHGSLNAFVALPLALWGVFRYESSQGGG